MQLRGIATIEVTEAIALVKKFWCYLRVAHTNYREILLSLEIHLNTI